MLRIALPNKGSLSQVASQMLTEAGYRQRSDSKELVLVDPPVTPSMLGVLQHDDDVPTEATRERLGIELTPLDETLAYYLRELQETT